MKLTNEIIAAIGELFENGSSISSIARQFQTSYQTAQKAVKLYQENELLDEDDSTEDPADAIDCQGYKLTPDCAQRLIAIKKRNGYRID